MIAFLRKLFAGKKKYYNPAAEDAIVNGFGFPIDSGSCLYDNIEQPKPKPKPGEYAAPITLRQYPNLLVILDPGHGESTPGKRSPAAAGTSKEYPELKLWEYKWNREEAELIANKLRAHGVQVEFTVNPDDPTDLGLTKRYKRANSIKSANPNKHAVFLSIHVNAAGSDGQWHNATGWEVWTTIGKNNSDRLADVLYLIALDVLRTVGQKVRGGKPSGNEGKEKNFTVIWGANMPAVLVENMFQDNPEDVKFLLSDSGRALLADICVQGILQYSLSQNWN